MALKLKIENCGGETHEIVVTYTDHGFEVEILNHDVECDLLREELGEKLPRCYHYATTITHDFDDLWGEIFQDDEVRIAFIKAISEQGVEAIEMTKEGFANDIIAFIDDNLRWRDDAAKVEDLLDTIQNDLPWFAEAKAFNENKFEIAELAYTWDAIGIFESLQSMIKKSKYPVDLVSLKISNYNEDYGPGHSERQAKFEFMIGDKRKDYWNALYDGWYWDIESMVWHSERLEESEKPEHVTIEFMEAAGIDYELQEMQELDPKEPSLPESDGEGDYAIFHDNYQWGQYKSLESANEVYNAMIDAIEHVGHSQDFDITLMKRREDLTEEELEDLDDDDIDKWEQY